MTSQTHEVSRDVRWGAAALSCVGLKGVLSSVCKGSDEGLQRSHQSHGQIFRCWFLFVSLYFLPRRWNLVGELSDFAQPSQKQHKEYLAGKRKDKECAFLNLRLSLKGRIRSGKIKSKFFPPQFCLLGADNDIMQKQPGQ